MRPAVVLAFTIGCSSSAISVPADRALLSWTGSSAADRNRAQLPNGFTAPDEHACAADTTRVYLAELFVNGIDNAPGNWHCAPIVGRPKATRPTLGQPE